MRFVSIAWLVLPLALAEKLIIPEVQDAVELQLNKFSKYVVDAENGTLESPSILGTHQSRDLESNHLGERQTASSYWYETIAHQGISAFNDNSSTYKVYRNVKDYGAQGYRETPLTIEQWRRNIANHIPVMASLMTRTRSTKLLVTAIDALPELALRVVPLMQLFTSPPVPMSSLRLS
jgi:hypothetical protein